MKGARVNGKKCCLNGCFRVLPIEAFGPHARSRDGLAPLCRECDTKRVQLYKHGMTGADKAAIADEQGGCAICGSLNPGPKGWVVDHDRSCCPGDRSCADCRRGILCNFCNTAMGYAKDSPEVLRRMADYLELGVRLGSQTGSESERKNIPRTNERDERTERSDTSGSNLQLANACGGLPK